jgi:hypothetical protein
MRRPSRFRKTDLTRATKAVIAAGLEVVSVEVSADGLIRIIPSNRKDICGPADTLLQGCGCHTSTSTGMYAAS